MELQPIRDKVSAPYLFVIKRALISNSMMYTFDLTVVDPMEENLSSDQIFSFENALYESLQECSPGSVFSVHCNKSRTGVEIQGLFRAGISEAQATYNMLEILRDALLKTSKMEFLNVDKHVNGYMGNHDIEPAKAISLRLLREFNSLRRVFKDPADEDNLKDTSVMIREISIVNNAVNEVLKNYVGMRNYPNIVEQIKADVSAVCDTISYDVTVGTLLETEGGDIYLETVPEVMNQSVLPMVVGDEVEEFRVIVSSMDHNKEDGMPDSVKIKKIFPDGEELVVTLKR